MNICWCLYKALEVAREEIERKATFTADTDLAGIYRSISVMRVSTVPLQ
jgi:hypothetical protein